MSEEQRRKLSAAQKAYVASDPRWTEHRRKLAEAQVARRMTLTPAEFQTVLARIMHQDGKIEELCDLGIRYDARARQRNIWPFSLNGHTKPGLRRQLMHNPG